MGPIGQIPNRPPPVLQPPIQLKNKEETEEYKSINDMFTVQLTVTYSKVSVKVKIISNSVRKGEFINLIAEMFSRRIIEELNDVNNANIAISRLVKNLIDCLSEGFHDITTIPTGAIIEFVFDKKNEYCSYNKIKIIIKYEYITFFRTTKSYQKTFGWNFQVYTQKINDILKQNIKNIFIMMFTQELDDEKYFILTNHNRFKNNYDTIKTKNILEKTETSKYSEKNKIFNVQLFITKYKITFKIEITSNTLKKVDFINFIVNKFFLELKAKNRYMSQENFASFNRGMESLRTYLNTVINGTTIPNGTTIEFVFNKLNNSEKIKIIVTFAGGQPTIYEWDFNSELNHKFDEHLISSFAKIFMIKSKRPENTNIFLLNINDDLGISFSQNYKKTVNRQCEHWEVR